MPMSKEKRIKLIIAICVCVVLALSFLTMLILVACGHEFKIDNLNEIFYNGRNSFWTGFFKVITHAGSVYFLILVVILLFMITRKKYYGFIGIICLIGAGAVNTVVKYIIRRDRPLDVALISEMGYSFPSGHSMLSMAVFGLIIYFVIKYSKNLAFKITMTSILSILILLIGLSRVYLGVHYFSDVLAGWLLGATFTLAMMIVVRIIYHHRKKLKNQATTEKEAKSSVSKENL